MKLCDHGVKLGEIVFRFNVFNRYRKEKFILNCDFSSKFVSEGLTFDDVLLIPAYSDIVSREIELKTTLARDIVLNTPIITAAMDTVTTSEMAIAIAREGGIGGIRSGMGYTGCKTIADLHEKAQFVRITGAGLKESHHHDIYITKEAPNYSASL